LLSVEIKTSFYSIFENFGFSFFSSGRTFFHQRCYSNSFLPKDKHKPFQKTWIQYLFSFQFQTFFINFLIIKSPFISLFSNLQKFQSTKFLFRQTNFQKYLNEKRWWIPRENIFSKNKDFLKISLENNFQSLLFKNAFEQ